MGEVSKKMFALKELNRVFSLPEEIVKIIYDYYIDKMIPIWQKEHKMKFNRDPSKILVLHHIASIENGRPIIEETRAIKGLCRKYKRSVLLRLVAKTTYLYYYLNHVRGPHSSIKNDLLSGWTIEF